MPGGTLPFSSDNVTPNWINLSMSTLTRSVWYWYSEELYGAAGERSGRGFRKSKRTAKGKKKKGKRNPEMDESDHALAKRPDGPRDNAWKLCVNGDDWVLVHQLSHVGDFLLHIVAPYLSNHLLVAFVWRHWLNKRRMQDPMSCCPSRLCERANRDERNCRRADRRSQSEENTTPTPMEERQGKTQKKAKALSLRR